MLIYSASSTPLPTGFTAAQASALDLCTTAFAALHRKTKTGRTGLHSFQLHPAHAARSQPPLAAPGAPEDEQAQRITAARHRVSLIQPGLLAQPTRCHNKELEGDPLAA